MRKIYDIDTVFGVTRDLPNNYVERKGVDDLFNRHIERKQHVTLYGGSKQGKTSLIKKSLKKEQYIRITCSNKWDIFSLNLAILKNSGYSLITKQTQSNDDKIKIKASLSSSIFGFRPSIGIDKNENINVSTEIKPLEIDPAEVNDLIFALEQIGFDRIIVLEDFHYLPIETQIDFSFELKAIHENSSLCFVVIGVWLENDRLISFNGDLTQRVFSVNADKWSEKDLKEVICRGEELLNITLPTSVKYEIIRESNNCVFLVQEACNKICNDLGIVKTLDNLLKISEEQISAKNAIDYVVNSQHLRFEAFLRQFTEGFQVSESAVNQYYKWILYAVIMSHSADLNNGLRIDKLVKNCRNKKGGKLQ